VRCRRLQDLPEQFWSRNFRLGTLHCVFLPLTLTGLWVFPISMEIPQIKRVPLLLMGESNENFLSCFRLCNWSKNIREKERLLSATGEMTWVWSKQLTQEWVSSGGKAFRRPLLLTLALRSSAILLAYSSSTEETRTKDQPPCPNSSCIEASSYPPCKSSFPPSSTFHQSPSTKDS